jgi:predicted MFS family arabinose efflux permease
MSYRALFALKPARRLALAAIPADFADWLDYTAIIALFVYVWHEGPLTLALYAVTASVPYALLGPILAVFTDRMNLRLVLVLSNLGRAIAIAALIVAPNAIVALVIILIRSSVDSQFTPARQAAIQATTPPELLPVANGLHHAINQTAKIAGPALGGLLLIVMPPQAVFGVNALFSLLAALMLLGISVPPRRSEARKPFLSELGAGLGEFGRSRLLLGGLIFSSTAYFAFFLYDSLFALLAQGFGLDTTIFGLSIAASGAGGLICALIAGRLDRIPPFVMMATAAFVSGAVSIVVAALALAGYSLPAVPYLILLALLGGSTAFMIVPYRTIVQQTTPPDRIARVVAAGEAVSIVAMLSAPFIGSLIAVAYGVAAAYLTGSIVLVVLAAVTFLFLLLRRPGA